MDDNRFQRSLTVINTLFKRRNYTNVTKSFVISPGFMAVRAITAHDKSVVCIWARYDTSKQVANFSKPNLVHVMKTVEDNVDHLILVADSVSFHIIDFMKHQQDLYWEALTFDDLACDKMAHVKVPTYRLLCEHEVLELERRFGPRHKFNRMIARVDAIARFMDFRVGDVLEISRKSTHAVTYRTVVSQDSSV